MIGKRDEFDTTYTYFKPSGKYKYEGRGHWPPCPDEGWRDIDRAAIMAANDGGMPGISTDASDLVVVVQPDDDCDARDAFPRMLRPS